MVVCAATGGGSALVSHGFLLLVILRFPALFAGAAAGTSAPRSLHFGFRRTSHLVRANASNLKNVVPAKIASSLVALLGSEEEAKGVTADLASKLYDCMRFLVPDGRRKHLCNDAKLIRSAVTMDSCTLRDGLGQDEQINELIWRPPKSVRDLALEAAQKRGNPKVLDDALNTTEVWVPDIENCAEDKCQLTKTTSGHRFRKEELNLYMAFLFETIQALAPLHGFGVSLNRYDLFHGHLFFTANSSRFGILFHAKEYPSYSDKTFPFHLGYCQKGSNLPYDYNINLRNILWLAPLPHISGNQDSFQWLAPGALMVLDAHPGGIIYEDLVDEGVKEFRTIYEDVFGATLMDVNYLNIQDCPPDCKIFMC